MYLAAPAIDSAFCHPMAPSTTDVPFLHLNNSNGPTLPIRSKILDEIRPAKILKPVKLLELANRSITRLNAEKRVERIMATTLNCCSFEQQSSFLSVPMKYDTKTMTSAEV